MTAETKNLLPIITAWAALLLGLFLVMGGIGHLSAVLPVFNDEAGGSAQSIRLPLPGLILCATGLGNLVLARGLWRSVRMALNAAIGLNALLLAYLVYLLNIGVAGHPLGIFAVSVAIFLITSLVTRAGLRWPAAEA